MNTDAGKVYDTPESIAAAQARGEELVRVANEAGKRIKEGRRPASAPPCPHRMLMFWGSDSQENGASCRKCGATWIHHRRYLRTPRGSVRIAVSRLVLTGRVRIEGGP